MIKKLRRKFISIAMLSVLLVLGSIIAIINIVNYIKINSYSDSVLNLLVQHEGRFPQNDSNVPFIPSIPDINGIYMSPETPFETRYFTVVVLHDGTLIAATGNIAAVSVVEAKEITQTLLNQGKTSGMYGDYKYATKAYDKSTMYVFLDCGRNMNIFRSFLLHSLLIGVGGLLLVFVLVIVLSGWALKPVEESYIKQKSFITNASHDIKTPFTVITADAEVIELMYGESDWTKDIKKQIERLTSLTDKLVFLSRMDENDYKLNFNIFALSEMVEETCLSYEATAALRGISLSLDIQSNVAFNGNEDALRRAVALLMDNAVKYVQSYVKVGLKQTGHTRELSFINDSDGVKQGNLNEFFDRFYRADKSRNSQTGGHGIGLSVVKSVIAAHKGKITAHSPDGKCVEFNITL